jgi:hypothetical protein
MNDLPPYGHLSAIYAAELANDALYIPLDWQATADEVKPSWERWKKHAIAHLDELWPAYRDDTEENHASRAARRLALTRYDLDLMDRAMFDQMSARVTTDEALDEREHWELYDKEDVVEPPRDLADTLPFYCPLLARSLEGLYVGSFATGRARKLGTVLLQLKTHFERPRGYQTSALLDSRRRYPFEHAASGATPSFVSAHCLQALMGGAYFYDRLVASGVRLPKSSVHSLQQFAADVGDRRVFAGVHYPSDSLGSWLVAVGLTPQVFAPSSASRALAFVSAAIRRSFVYRTLNEENDAAVLAAMTMLKSQMAA